MPAETSFYDMLFDRILESEFDVIQLSHVKTPSFLWSYLRSSPMIRECFSFYTPWGVSSHSLIHLSGSFASYMNKFSPKARKNRRRENPKTARRGYAVRSLSLGIGARDLDMVRNEMHFLA